MINMQILVALLLNALALIITANLVPGFKVDSFTSAILAAIVLGVINTFIKPVLVVLTLPLNVLTLGLFSFVINAVVLWLASAVVPGLMLDGWVPAILAAVVLSVVSTVLSMVLKDIAPGKK